MARSIERDPFNPQQTLYARKVFRAAGRRFTKGMEFPWKQMALDERRVFQMYNGGFLTHKGATAIAAPAPRTNPAEHIQSFDLEDIPTSEADDTEWSDGLETLTMDELKLIADGEKAPRKRSKSEQIQAIREARGLTES